MSEIHPFGSGSYAPLEDPNEMPACYPIKGTTDSMKYHRPDSGSYGETVAEVWFVAPSIAEAAGFSLASSHPDDVSSADFEPGQAGHPCTAADLTEMGVSAIAHPYGPGSHVPLRDPLEMPECYIIKGNADSMLFHRPDSANYGATIAEVWFISPSLAEAAGYSLASSHPDGSSSADFELGAGGNPCTAQRLRELGLGVVAQPYGTGSHAPLEDPRQMPECYPIKGNVDSMVFHRPDSTNYAAIAAEVWFVSPSAAEAAGFSLSSTHPAGSSSANFEPGAPGHTCEASDLIALGLSALVHPFGPSSRAPLGNVREMPECYPIKGNVDSMLFHRPDSANYGATVAEVWFVSPSAAEAAGFSLSTTHPKGSSSADFELSGSGHPCTAAKFGGIIAAGAAATSAAAVRLGVGDSDGSTGGRAGSVQSLVADPGAATGVASASAAGRTAESADGGSGIGDAGKAIAGAAAGAVVAGVAGIAGAFSDDDDDTMDAAAAANAAEKAAAAKAAAAKAAADRAAAENAEKAAAEKVAAEKVAAEKVAAEKVAAEKVAAEKVAAEKVAAEKVAADKAAAEKVAAEKVAAEKVAAEKAAAEKVAAEKAAAEKVAADKAAAEKVAADKAAAEKVAADKAAAVDASLSNDETLASKDAAAMRETVQMAAAVAAPPFGAGSHAPFADVHEMPACHPIKGNADSMKYHRPDSQGYPKTKAEVWFVSPSVAEAAGFALAGSHPEGSSSADFEPGGAGHPCTAEQVAGLGLPGGGAAVAAAGAAGAAAASASDRATKATAQIDAAADIDDTVRMPAASSTGGQVGELAGAAAAGSAAEDSDSADETDDDRGFGKSAAMAAAGAGIAAVAGAASLLGPGDDDDDDDLNAADLNADETISAEQAAAHRAADVPKGARDTIVDGTSGDGSAGDDTSVEDTSEGLGKAAVAAGAAGAAAVGAAALLGADDDDTAGAAVAAGSDARETIGTGGAGARDTIVDATSAEDTSGDDTSEGLGKAAVAAGAAGAAAVGAAALLGADDDDTAGAAVAAGSDARETIRTEAAGARDTIDDDTTGALGKGAAAAAGVAGLAGAAARAGDGGKGAAGTGKAAAGAAAGKGKAAAGAAAGTGKAAAGAAAGKGKAAAGAAAGKGKAAAGKVAAGAGAAGAVGASRLGGIGGGGGGDDDRGVVGGGRFGWLKWLLPLLLLALLLALLLTLCGGSDDGVVASQPDPTAIVDPTEEPESEPTAEPTAEPAPDPTAEPTAEPTPEPAPDPTATPEPEPTPEPVAACAALVPTLEENGFTTLLALLSVAELGDELSDAGPLTLFAPTNEAFDALPEVIASTVQSNVRLLDQVLRYHVVPGAVLSGDLAPSGVETLNGSSLTIRTDGAAPTANAAGISPTDLLADACVIHGVDALLIPPSLLTSLGIASLNNAVGGEAITFVDGSADFTDADSDTLKAICNLVATEDSIDGLPAVQWQSSGDDAVDAERSAAIDEVLASCGPGGLALDQLAAKPSFTG